MKPQIVFLDAGHGGLNQSGRYMTAPNKMYKHHKGTFHDGGWFYEGVFNRQIVNLVAEKLEALKVPYMIVSHYWRDNSLWYRVNKANWHHQLTQMGIYISSHANAFTGNDAGVRGYEVHYFPGSESGKELAEIHNQHTKELLGDQIKYRENKESNFYVLRKTVMPSILIEHLYFDNYEDALLLMDEEIQERFAEAQVRTIIKAMQA